MISSSKRPTLVWVNNPCREGCIQAQIRIFAQASVSQLHSRFPITYEITRFAADLGVSPAHGF